MSGPRKRKPRKSVPARLPETVLPLRDVFRVGDDFGDIVDDEREEIRAILDRWKFDS